MRTSTAAAALLALTLASNSQARMGIDISTPVSASQAACLKANFSIDFAVSRAWYSNGDGVDHAAITSGTAFHSAGIDFDIYAFPCSFGLNATSQVQELLANMTAAGVEFKTLWMDIETNTDSRCAWSKDTTRNCAFLDELLAAAVAAVGASRVGVYSSIHMWTEIMTSASNPNGCTVGASRGLSLW